jgi:hypothetical protein
MCSIHVPGVGWLDVAIVIMRVSILTDAHMHAPPCMTIRAALEYTDSRQQQEHAVHVPARTSNQQPKPRNTPKHATYTMKTRAFMLIVCTCVQLQSQCLHRVV